MKDFLGLQYEPGVSPIETVDKVKAVCHYIGTINVQALLVGLACMAVLILWPMLTKVLKGKAAKIVGSIPPSLLAVILGIAFVSGLGLKVNTIGTLYEISNKPPMLQIPAINFRLIQAQFGNALTIAILAAVESLLSCVVSDSMINSRHRSNMELHREPVTLLPLYLVEFRQPVQLREPQPMSKTVDAPLFQEWCIP